MNTTILRPRTNRVFIAMNLFALLFATIGCELPLKDPAPSAAQQSTFDYATTASVRVQGTFRSGSDNILPGVPFSVYTEEPNGTVPAVANGASNADGSFDLTVNIPTAVTSIYLTTDYIGLPSVYKIAVSQQSAMLKNALIMNNVQRSLGKSSAVYIPALKYLGTWKADGTPNYLLPQQDIIDAGLLARLNESLPETQSLLKHHPEYLTTSDKSMLLRERADVWVTFIHEGAGYMNVLGFYTYPSGKAPVRVEDIESITVIFPNVSYSGSGGGLRSGDKVYIGQFEPGTEIGWVVFSNGFSGGKISSGNWMLFSNQALNGVKDPALQQHNVLLNDIGFDRVILGFEDIKRSTGGDQDFNDCLFSVTSNPVKAIVTEALANVDVPLDTDGDGVTDSKDAYPNDPLRAFNSYTPGLNQYNTLAFEDLWPGRGDEDFNDLVISYTARTVSNARNEVVEMNLNYVLRAIGANYKLGFGFSLPVDETAVKSVTSSAAGSTVQPMNANGTEAGQSNATVILFDNAYSILKRPNGGFVNTEPSAGYVVPETIAVTIHFTQPVNPQQLGTAPFNPFIFVNERSKEIHLPNQPPTSLADTKWFGTSFDNSSAAKNIYYLTRDGKPWALNIVGTFEYPWERATIQSGYNNFTVWAQSKGSVYPDWYANKTGFRNAAKLWKKQ